MTIAKGNRIEYRDLVNQVVNKIKSICQNIDSFKNVPADIQNNYTIYSSSADLDRAFSVSVKDDFMNPDKNVVSTATLTNDIESFLSQRCINISAKEGRMVITTRDILNFYQNIAIFIDARVVQVAASHTNSKVTFYDKNGSFDSAANIGTDNPGTKINSTNLNNLFTTLDTSLANISRVHQVKQDWVCH